MMILKEKFKKKHKSNEVWQDQLNQGIRNI
jgi:hypothetical protein